MTKELRAFADRLDVLAHAVTEANWSEFSMRVPVEPERDADCVLSSAARELRAYATMQVEDVVRDAARWRFFCDNIGRSYGDGYSEPREESACLEWQQGPWIRDGSNGGRGRADTFPGWSAILDKMMEDERRALEDLDDPLDAAMGERHG